MATAAVETPAPAPAVPDYLLDPDAVMKDNVTWRHGSAPDYSGTRKMYAQTKKSSHTKGSLEDMVENLVKNWEVEASHKMKISEWRTIDPETYTFAVNGGPAQDAAHMLKVGTYNAIIAPNQFYSPTHSDLEGSHKTFREMMPVFTWEVLEVYSPPPTVAFKWRHWGEMRADYVGWNDKGEKITIKAHGGTLDIQGVTVAKLSDKLQVKALETWFDPLDMFNQMKPTAEGNTANVEVVVDGHKLPPAEAAAVIQEQITTSAADKDFKDLAEQIDRSDVVLADAEGVTLRNPTSPVEAHHSSEATSSAATGNANGHGGDGIARGSCPFRAF